MNLQVLIFLLLFAVNFAWTQDHHSLIADDIEYAKQHYSSELQQLQFIELNESSVNNNIGVELDEGLKTYDNLTLEQGKLSNLLITKPHLLSISVPNTSVLQSLGLNDLTLELIRFNLFAEDFEQILMPSGRVQQANELDLGISYHGIVKGVDQSLAMVFIQNEEISIILSTPLVPNLMIEKVIHSDSHYVLYEQAALLHKPDFSCEAIKAPHSDEHSEGGSTAHLNSVEGCMTVHVDIGKSIYDARGNNATAYIQNIFSFVSTMYSNESINLSISTTTLWTNSEPFSNLGQYSNYRLNNPVDATFSHYVNNTFGGGIAYLNSYCAASNRYAVGISGLDNEDPLPLPDYSWPVNVVTHELGHNFGSEHTHDCAWNGNNTPIDGCGSQYNGCGESNYLPPEGGTVMSYCHLQPVGMNLSLGFGSQPGDRIRYYANQATCTDCNDCTAQTLSQYTNTNNGGYVSGNSVTVNSGDALILDMGGSFGSDWNFTYTRPDGTNFPGGTNGVANDQMNLTAGAVENGTWEVNYTDPNGCTNSANFIVDVAISGTICTGNTYQYRITSMSSQKVLDVAGYSTSNGGNVHQWGYGGGNNQKWYFEDAGNNAYQIINVNSGKVLDVAGVSTANGGNIHQWDYIGGNNQKWYIEDVGDGAYRIVNVNSGKVVDVDGNSPIDGGNIHQWDYFGSDNQKWYIETVTGTCVDCTAQTLTQYTNTNNGGYVAGNSVTVDSGDGLLLDMGGSFGNDWSFTYTRPDGTSFPGGTNGVANDQMYITAAAVDEGTWQVDYTDPSGCTNSGTFSVEVLINGICTGSANQYRITSVQSGLALDVAGNSTSNGGNIHQWGYFGANNQKWYFEDAGGGAYAIFSVNSSLVLDVAGNSTSNGANVHQWGYFGANNQKWYVEDVGGGAVRITSVNSGKVLDVAGYSNSNGGNIHQWSYGGGNNQKWYLEQVSGNCTSGLVTGEDSNNEAAPSLIRNYVQSINEQFGITAYPNPFNNELNIQANNEIEQIQIFDLSGKLVHRQQAILSKRWDVKTVEWIAGVYLVKIQLRNGETKAIRVVK